MPSTRKARSTDTGVAADFAAGRRAIPVVAAQAAALVAGIRDPEAKSALVPWTVGEVAVHLANVCLAYAESAADEFGDWMDAMPARPELRDRLGELNTLMLDLIPREERARIPDLLGERGRALVEATEGRDPHEPCRSPWFGEGDTVPLSAVVGLFLSESLLHSVDIARASGQRFRIDPEHARLVLSLVFPPMMPKTVNTGLAQELTADLRFHVRGGVTIGAAVRDGNVTVTRNPAAGSGRADCHILLDPVAFLLVASGRTGRGGQIARGRMLPYGRKPWLGPAALRLFWFP